MAPADDDVVGEKSTFRWLDAVRYALAFVVTVLIVTVIAHAIVVVLRPEKLTLRVVGGSVQVEINSTSALDPSLTFIFNLRAVNPGGRARIYYTNIDGHLRGKIATSTSPALDFIDFSFDDIAVEQNILEDSNTQVTDHNESTRIPYFNMLYNGGSIPDAMLWLNGTLTTEIYSGYNKTDDRPTIYCCSPLTVGSDSSKYTAVDVVCTKDDPTCNTT